MRVPLRITTRGARRNKAGLQVACQAPPARPNSLMKLQKTLLMLCVTSWPRYCDATIITNRIALNRLANAVGAADSGIYCENEQELSMPSDGAAQPSMIMAEACPLVFSYFIGHHHDLSASHGCSAPMPSMSGSSDERARRLQGCLHETAVCEEENETRTAREKSGVLFVSAAATSAGVSSCVSFFSTHAGAIFTTSAITTWRAGASSSTASSSPRRRCQR